MKQTLVALGIAVLVGGFPRALLAQNPPTKDPLPIATANTSPSELLQIDGRKNPELIPQWSAWGYAFRVIAGGPGLLPKAVHEVVSREETDLVVKEAQAIQKVDQTCQDRLLALYPLIGTEPNASLDAKLRALTLECRWATLHARDRILAALNPAGAAALTQFVDSTKAGTTISVRKKDLARFLEPQ